MTLWIAALKFCRIFCVSRDCFDLNRYWLTRRQQRLWTATWPRCRSLWVDRVKSRSAKHRLPARTVTQLCRRAPMTLIDPTWTHFSRQPSWPRLSSRSHNWARANLTTYILNINLQRPCHQNDCDSEFRRLANICTSDTDAGYNSDNLSDTGQLFKIAQENRYIYFPWKCTHSNRRISLFSVKLLLEHVSLNIHRIGYILPVLCFWIRCCFCVCVVVS